MNVNTFSTFFYPFFQYVNNPLDLSILGENKNTKLPIYHLFNYLF